ncbi:MAG: HlyD family efflux transporter periplasmic adaptor subunit [Candidatus Marinimicrobia bacterium]|nr:HlyD family efflux transporter periplasmic adaptor subunit [Candidatus Neomarinimicrobiota bacterium]
MDKILEKKRWSLKRLLWMGAGGVLIVSVGFGLVGSDRGSSVNLSGSRLTVTTVHQGQFQEFIPVTGPVVPIRTIYLDAVEGGRVEKRFLEAGSYVNEGDPILQLSNTNLLLDIMYREAELYQQSNNLRNTQLAMEQNRLALQSELLELNYKITRITRVNERNRQLLEKSLVSTREFDESNDEYRYLLKRRDLTLQSHRQDSIFRATQIDQLEASLARMENNLELVKLNQDNLLVRAPVSGHLTSLSAEVGESKVRGERLGQIDILDGFKASLAIDEHYITRVLPGQRGTFNLGNREYSMVLAKIYPEVVNGQFEVDMHFDGEIPAGIRRGQTLRIRLALGELSDAVLMARGGFFNTTGGQWVYKLEPGGNVATKQQIRLGRQNQDEYEVLAGLQPGDRVITSSYDHIGDFDRVVLDD